MNPVTKQCFRGLIRLRKIVFRKMFLPINRISYFANSFYFITEKIRRLSFRKRKYDSTQIRVFLQLASIS